MPIRAPAAPSYCAEMRHRVSAAGIVVRDDALLLVRHVQPGLYDFYVPPGGGLEGAESVLEGAEREVFEETGLLVRALRPVYVQEIIEPDARILKTFVLCEERGGHRTPDHRVPGERDRLAEARFVPTAELPTLNVVPTVFRGEFWHDLAVGASSLRYLGTERASVM